MLQAAAGVTKHIAFKKNSSNTSALALLLYFQPQRFTDLTNSCERLATEDSRFNETKLKTLHQSRQTDGPREFKGVRRSFHIKANSRESKRTETRAAGSTEASETRHMN
ncbi:hypothetical protein QQF64_021497 [Cirrhinus molitorella]|uniref:Uncharacterized protein n=1 Tax=Cirrhinus molitorella TaxID=172907 RepID=A0ABR3L5I5_9TELE